MRLHGFHTEGVAKGVLSPLVHCPYRVAIPWGYTSYSGMRGYGYVIQLLHTGKTQGEESKE